MSYTTFEYSNLRVNKASLDPNETVVVNVTIKNTGSRDGKEAVLLFVSDLQASLSPDVKRLRGFEKITLRAGESKTVEFRIAIKELAFVNSDNKRIVEQGVFSVQAGNQAGKFLVNKTLVY
jgi:beta-glucosidase